MFDAFYNLEAERSVLGAVLMDSVEVLDQIEIKYSDFFETANRYIAKGIEELNSKGQAIDLVTLSTWLGENKLLEQVGGIPYLSELAGSVPTIANVKFYSEIVKKQARKRKVQKTLKRMLEKLPETDDADELDVLVSKGIDSLQNTSTELRNGFTHIREVMIDVLNHAEEERGDVIGIPTGFSGLDRMTSGWKGGELIIIGARPAMGRYLPRKLVIA